MYCENVLFHEFHSHVQCEDHFNLNKRILMHLFKLHEHANAIMIFFSQKGVQITFPLHCGEKPEYKLDLSFWSHAFLVTCQSCSNDLVGLTNRPFLSETILLSDRQCISVLLVMFDKDISKYKHLNSCLKACKNYLF